MNMPTLQLKVKCNLTETTIFALFRCFFNSLSFLITFYYMIFRRVTLQLHYSQFFMCTGPKENTFNDFWSMVWQTNVEQIVMLTNLMEGTRVINKTQCLIYVNQIKEIIRLYSYFLILFLNELCFSEKMCSILASLKNIDELWDFHIIHHRRKAIRLLCYSYAENDKHVGN